MRRLLAGVICLLVAGCAPSIQVRSSFDPQADFSKATTYSWLNDVDQPSDNVRVNNELTRKTVRQAVEQALEEKGFTRVEDQQADLLVAWFGAIKTKIRSEGIEHFYSPYGYGPLYKDPYWNTQPTAFKVSEYEQGTLIIDVLDPIQQRLLWRGIGSGQVVEDQPEETARKNLTSAVKQIMEKFPPR
jgi:hypothetical protein